MRKLKVIVIGLILGILFSIVIFLLIPIHLSKVLSNSMEPTLIIGDFILYDITLTPIQGDIIVFLHHNKNENKKLVKRVLGCPSDTIEFNEYGVYVNNQLKISGDFTYCEDKYFVPEDSYFVIGDNHLSLDIGIVLLFRERMF